MIFSLLNLVVPLIHGLDTNSKTCTLNSAWVAVRTMGSTCSFYQLVWVTSTSPKMSTYILRALHNKLLTCDILMSICVISQNQCAFCSSVEENRDHLFFNCPYSSDI